MGQVRIAVVVYWVLCFVLVKQVSADTIQAKSGKDKAVKSSTAKMEKKTPATTTPAATQPSETTPEPITPVVTPPSVSTEAKTPLKNKYRSAPESGYCGNWNCFLVGAGAMFDSDGGSSGAFSISYIPVVYLARHLSLKGYVGGILSNVFAGSAFGMGDLALTLKYNFYVPFWVEAGGGLQYWSDKRLRNTFPQIKTALGFKWFQINYSSVSDSLLTTHQIIGAISIAI